MTFYHDIIIFPIEPNGNATVSKLTIIHCIQDNALRFCDDTHKHTCPPKMSPLENVLKCKHLFISRVRIEILYFSNFMVNYL